MKALVVDDNQDAAEVLGLLLQGWGLEVEIAFDGASGLDLATRRVPEIMLVDLHMPVLDGFEVARQVRARKLGSTGLTLAAVTAWAHQSIRTRVLEAGFDAHLVKPTSAEDVRELLADHLRRRGEAGAGSDGVGRSDPRSDPSWRSSPGC